MVMLPETLGREHFVRTLVTYLAAAAVTLHMLLGCCWHHAHASGSDCRTAAICDTHDGEMQREVADHDHHVDCPHHDADADATEHADHSEFDRHGDHSRQGDQHQSGSQHESCGEKCSFVAANRVNCELDAAVVVFGAFATAEVVATENEFVVRRFEARGASDAPPPLRLHLLHQLLLI